MLWGPLCFLLVCLIVKESSFRHPVQLIVSCGQLYGDILYYATSMFDLYYHGLHYCRPEAYYFWGYYFFMNIIWIIVPSCKLIDTLTLPQLTFFRHTCVEHQANFNSIQGSEFQHEYEEDEIILYAWRYCMYTK